MPPSSRLPVALGLLTLASLLGVVVTATSRAADLVGAYRLLREVPIGGEGGWDYLSVDEAARRLYVTHASKVVVVELAGDTIVGEIADTPGVHGFALAPELRRGFASNGRENTVSVVDLDTLQTVAKVETGQNPDAILYEPGQQEAYAFNGQSNSVTVIDAATYRVVATVALAPGEEATGMATDMAHQRLFLGCHNRRLSTKPVLPQVVWRTRRQNSTLIHYRQQVAPVKWGSFPDPCKAARRGLTGNRKSLPVRIEHA